MEGAEEVEGCREMEGSGGVQRGGVNRREMERCGSEKWKEVERTEGLFLSILKPQDIFVRISIFQLKFHYDLLGLI